MHVKVVSLNVRVCQNEGNVVAEDQITLFMRKYIKEVLRCVFVKLVKDLGPQFGWNLAGRVKTWRNVSVHLMHDELTKHVLT